MVRAFYKQILIRLAGEEGRPLWKDLVYDIQIDYTMKLYPKVIQSEKEAQHAEKARDNKRHAGGQLGPAANTPLSIHRKSKGCKRNKGSDKMVEDEPAASTDTSDDEIEISPADAQLATPVKHRQDRQNRTVLTEQQPNKAANDTRPPAGLQKPRAEETNQWESGVQAAGGKENTTTL